MPAAAHSPARNVTHRGGYTGEKLRPAQHALRQDIAPLPRDLECRWILTVSRVQGRHVFVNLRAQAEERVFAYYFTDSLA
jgi:hypothetical protein